MNKIILFRTTRDVIRADRLCKEHHLPVTVRPVPVKIAAQCGMCLEIEEKEIVRLCDLLEMNKIEMKIYK